MYRRPDAGISADDAVDPDDELVTNRAPRPVEWFLLTGNRSIIAAGVLIAFFAVLWSLLVAGIVATANGRFIVRMLAGLITANVTLLTVVIAINQLIISREFNSPG
jgi:hypothetical protein